MWADSGRPALVTAQLVSEVTSLRPEQRFEVALRLVITPEWHVYWRNPGDSGMAPRLSWNLPPGTTVSEIQWPYPARLPAGPLLNFGYEGEVYLPMTVRATGRPGETLTLRARADWLVCKEDCIPEQANLELTLPVADRAPVPDPRWQAGFGRTRQALPQPLGRPGLYERQGDNWVFQIPRDALPDASLRKATFFPYADGVITNAAPQQFTAGRENVWLVVQAGQTPDPGRIQGVLVVEGTGTGAYELTLEPGQVAGRPQPGAVLGYQALILAFFGGLLLNAMPCVFPILSLKTLHLTQRVTQSLGTMRWGAIAFTVGVLATLVGLAGALLTLRAWGEQVGWGFQLQSPLVVTLLAYVLFAVGLSLSGVFTVGARWMGIGQGLTDQAGWRGEFFTGVLAVVAATPCTAPFMATAIGAALVQPLPVALGIFVSLGLGFALPYLALSWVPGWRRWLPKPGPWMATLQQLLAFPVYGVVAWLVWVQAQQSGSEGLSVLLGGLVLIALAAWLHQKSVTAGRPWQRLGQAGALGVVALILAVTLPLGWPQPT
ncbi:MAG: thiol:disulfide interchange protein, partial [Gloeomargaritaceae cyanobacterium C42_A2020_066]|nr:thiol:disulfide interchange protein [Gloeomargaritaceae cyanobacterium C42_A2020_066]